MTLPRGRPVDLAARERVLVAVRALLRERGLSAVTMDAVAQSASVGKQSLYRWWPSKSALLAQATLTSMGDLPARADGTTIDEWIDRSIEALSSEEGAGVLRAMLASAAADDDAAERLRTLVLARHQERLTEILVDAGHDADRAGTTAEMLVAALFFWVASRQPLDAERRAALARLAAPPGA